MLEVMPSVDSDCGVEEEVRDIGFVQATASVRHEFPGADHVPIILEVEATAGVA